MVLLGLFLGQERRVEEPILPLRLLAHRTRSSANASRALLYAGFYGLFYFIAQFLQDVQGYSPLDDRARLPSHADSVFLSSQLASRVLAPAASPRRSWPSERRCRLGLLLATRVDGSTGYLQIVVSLVLIGAGSGIAFVALTSASLAEVAPGDAGAASGLVNVSQQIGAALGLAVLVTIFEAQDGHAELQPGTDSSAHAAGVVHALDAVFGFGALFALAALVTIIVGIQGTRAEVASAVPAPEFDDVPLEALAVAPSMRTAALPDRCPMVQGSGQAAYCTPRNAASGSSAISIEPVP